MQAPRDLARRDLWAQSVARALTPLSLAPALAAERDLSDPGIWQESIWRSQRRREAIERQLNFGPLTGKRVAVPLAMLAAGLMVRDAAGSGDGLASFLPSSAGGAGAPAVKRVADRVQQVRPATVAGRQAKLANPPTHQVKQATASSIAAARPKPPKNPMADGELTRGEHGAAVAAMQQQLGVAADGIYGSSTLSAVKTFQKGQGLVPDGRVGPATLEALAHPRPVTKPSRASKPDHHAATAAHVHVHGNGVKALQSALGIPADGVFGRETAHAVRVFQRQKGLKADGVVGPATWSALGVRNSGKVLKQERARSHRGAAGGRSSGRGGHRGAASGGGGHHGTSVADLQRLLGIPADGVFGRQTGRAVREFQRHHGLRADGVVGPATWAALGLPNAQRILHPQHAAAGPRHHGGGGGASGASGIVARAIAAGDRIATLPYKYGGGHGSFNDSGYDCSGSVSYVLHGAGLLSSPLDSTGLESYGAPGPGRHITIYANSGHTFMVIDGRRFDTGYGGEGNRWASGSRPTSGYVVRHPPGL